MNDSLNSAEQTKIGIVDVLCNVNKSFSSKESKVKLTDREEEYIVLSSLGLLNREIAVILKVTITTVKKTLSKIMLKLNARNKAQCITLLSLNNNVITKEKISEISAKYLEQLNKE